MGCVFIFFNQIKSNKSDINNQVVVMIFFPRFITILYYLQDVEGGGETAFPLAEFENVSKEVKYSNFLPLR